MFKNVQIQVGKKKLTHADNDIYGIIERYATPVRFSFINNEVLYTEEQVKTSIRKLIDADLIEQVEDNKYQIKTNEN